MLKWHCALLKNGYIDVVQRGFAVVSTLNTDIVSMLCNVKNPISILSHFQRQINSISTVIHNVETTLIQPWNVGRAVSMKKSILRIILPATLLTKLNLKILFKDYTATLTTPTFTIFFWQLLLRVCLRLVISNSSDLKKVSS